MKVPLLPLHKQRGGILLFSDLFCIIIWVLLRICCVHKERLWEREMSLDHLANRIAKQDQEAFAELYEKTRKIVYSICLSIVKDGGIAEELTQDTFVSVWSEIGKFRGKGLKTWVLTIAKNKALNVLRKRKRETVVDFFENEGTLGNYAEETVYSIENNITTNLVLSAALELLDAVDRQIVLLKNSGMKTKEIAEFLAMPRGTVSWRYSEALKTLKKYLEAQE